MNQDNLENRMERRWEHFEHRRRRGSIWAGLFLLLVGGLLLLKTMNVLLFPFWFFTWPVLLIALGLFLGIRHGFRGGLWLILLIVGGLNLYNNIYPSSEIRRYIAPLAIIAIGLMFILRPRRNHWRSWRDRYGKSEAFSGSDDTGSTQGFSNSADASVSKSDFVDITSIFGGVKKNILSKNFQGGDIVSFMGGSEIDLTQADFKGKAKIDVTNILGGTKLIVPSGWDVQSEVVAIFGGVDDKRQINGVTIDHDKVLVLDGTCIFGGLEIRSF